MSKERELLEAFRQWYDENYISPLIFDDIEDFLSSRPEEKEYGLLCIDDCVVSEGLTIDRYYEIKAEFDNYYVILDDNETLEIYDSNLFKKVEK